MYFYTRVRLIIIYLNIIVDISKKLFFLLYFSIRFFRKDFNEFLIEAYLLRVFEGEPLRRKGNYYNR